MHEPPTGDEHAPTLVLTRNLSLAREAFNEKDAEKSRLAHTVRARASVDDHTAVSVRVRASSSHHVCHGWGWGGGQER